MCVFPPSLGDARVAEGLLRVSFADIKSKFSAIYKQHSPPGRLLRVHVTCATVRPCFVRSHSAAA